MGYPQCLRWLVPALLLVGHIADAQVRVRGYTRRDGTYVAPHYRSEPDGIFSNNWSTYGNVNPFTGAYGTRSSPPEGYGADVYVRGYSRNDGTYIAPHYRSTPDGNPWNNWSTDGNVNPYTGVVGRDHPSLSTGYQDPGRSYLEGFAAARRTRQQARTEQVEQLRLTLSLQAALRAREQTASLAPSPAVPARRTVIRNVAPAQPATAPAAGASSSPMRDRAVGGPAMPQPPRKKTAPGTVRIGIQRGQFSAEVLEVAVTRVDNRTLRFEWKELGRPVSVRASDESAPAEVVRRYREGLVTADR